MAPAWKDDSGFTLPELLLGMLLSLAIAAASLMIMQSTLHSQKETGSRLAAQDDGSFAMLRLTKDIRTATAATVQDSRTLDLLVPQHDPAGGAPVAAHVRYVCAAACTRYTCGTPFSSNACGSATNPVVVAGGVANTDNFRGVSRGVDQAFPATTPATWAGSGTPAQDNVGFISVHLEVRRNDDPGPWRHDQPLDFHDGADLANFTN